MSFISNIVIPGLLNITCTVITDICKAYGKRPWDKTINREVGEFIEEYTDTELDSGAFCTFLSRTETSMNIKEYIRFSSFAQNHKIRIAKKDMNITLTKDVFIENLSLSAINFVKDTSGKLLQKRSVVSYFENVMSILETRLTNSLDTAQLGMLYFFNQSLNEMEKRIINSLGIKLKIENNNFENIREKYIKILKNKNKKSHVYGFKELDFYSFYIFPQFNIIGEGLKHKRTNSIEWRNIFNESNMVSIIGGAGFGKSLFLKNLINKFEELNILNSKEIVPIYCDLKQFKQFGKNRSSYSVEEFLVDSIINHTGLDKKEITKDFISYFMNSGRCLILFDALDEVDSQDRNELNSTIMAFFEETNKHNKVCLTSRSQGFISKTRITYSASPVQKEEIREYLDNMCKLDLFSSKYIDGFMKKCSLLISSGFLLSLLQVSLLVHIYKAELELPENKIELYEKCIEYISKKREIDKKKTEFNFDFISSILDSSSSFEKLAFLAKPNNIEIHESKIHELFSEMFKRSYGNNLNQALIATKEFLRFCSNRTELYVIGTQEYHYKFFHRSFFEYFYSKQLIKQFSENEDLINELYTYDLDSEVFELTAALLKKHDYNRYTSLMDLALEKVIIYSENMNEEIEGNLLKLCLLFNASPEQYYIDQLTHIFLNESKMLLKLTNKKASDSIYPIICRGVILGDKSKLFPLLMEYYGDEISVSYFFDYLIEKIIDKEDFDIRFDFDIVINPIFNYLGLIVSNNLIEAYLSALEVEYLDSLIKKYVATSNGKVFKYIERNTKSFFNKRTTYKSSKG